LLLLYAIILLSAMGGCKGNEDYGYPEIAVAQPLPGSIFENGDTIKFQATCTDKNKLTTIELILVDQDNKPVLPLVSITPNKNPFSLQGDYVITDLMLPSGKYYLNFKAYNGENMTNKFVEIQTSELAMEMLYPIVVTHSENDTWGAYRFTKENNWIKFISNTGDYSGCAINSAESQFYMCGNSISNLSSVKVPEGLLQWNVKPVYHQSQRWFQGITFRFPTLYVSCAEGNIRGYNKLGKEIYKSESFPNAEPHHIAITNNFVVAEFVDAFSTDRFLVAFHNPGGKMFSSKFYSGDVVGLIHTTGDKCLVLCNKNGQGSIMQYDASDNTLSILHPFYDGIFVALAKMDSDNYIISSNSGVYHYRLSNNSLITLVLESKNATIACDNTSQQFYVCSGKEMQVYNFPIPVLLEKIQLPDSIVDLHLVFNK